MLNVIDNNSHNQWNAIVKLFDHWDVYYLYEYAHSFELHGDGKPLLIYFEDGEFRLCYVTMKQDISTSPKFCGGISENTYFDMETPYGYGGPLMNGNVSEHTEKLLISEINSYCESEGIVSQFVRFHPLLNNNSSLNNLFETRYMRDTVYIDTSSPETIMANMDSKNRNMVRKAGKSGVTIEKRAIDDYIDFMPIYEETMLKDNAYEYYTFKNDYFESLKDMSENACIFFSLLDGRPISGAIMFFNNEFMHYHLAGTRTEYRKYSPNNLLLYEAACWASEKGIKMFHLGGGMTPDDSLFGFKKQFNKISRLPFVVGRTIFDQSKYDELLQIRKKLDEDFDENNRFMIQYRR